MLRARLASQRGRAWVQAVVSRPAGEAAQLLRALVRVGASPQLGSERRWSYEDYDFISLVVPARRVAPLCVTGPQEIALGQLRATLELRAANVSWRRRPSLALYKDLSLPYPATIYEAPLADQAGAADSIYLVGAEETPSFATLGSAFNAFFFDDFAATGTSCTLLGELLVCFVHTKARICGVRIRPASLDVRVGGRSWSTLISSWLAPNTGQLSSWTGPDGYQFRFRPVCPRTPGFGSKRARSGSTTVRLFPGVGS